MPKLNDSAAPDQGAAAASASPELTKALDTLLNMPDASKTDPEAAWRATLAPEMQPVALRHGQKLFAACFTLGLVGEGLKMLQQGTMRAVMTLQGANARKTAAEVGQHLGQAGRIVADGFNYFASETIRLAGFTEAQLNECSTDIQRAAALRMAGSDTPSGQIILPH